MAVADLAVYRSDNLGDLLEPLGEGEYEYPFRLHKAGVGLEDQRPPAAVSPALSDVLDGVEQDGLPGPKHSCVATEPHPLDECGFVQSSFAHCYS